MSVGGDASVADGSCWRTVMGIEVETGYYD